MKQSMTGRMLECVCVCLFVCVCECPCPCVFTWTRDRLCPRCEREPVVDFDTTLHNVTSSVCVSECAFERESGVLSVLRAHLFLSLALTFSFEPLACGQLSVYQLLCVCLQYASLTPTHQHWPAHTSLSVMSDQLGTSEGPHSLLSRSFHFLPARLSICLLSLLVSITGLAKQQLFSKEIQPTTASCPKITSAHSCTHTRSLVYTHTNAIGCTIVRNAVMLSSWVMVV